jgi:hypothetical protein
MRFKENGMKDQLEQGPQKLKEVVLYFSHLSEQCGIEPVVTRVWDAVTGDSGVHEAKRGCDCRDEYTCDDGEKKRLYTDEQVSDLVSAMNLAFPRADGRLVCIHHSFQGGPMHFHFQIPISWA